jgi:cysteine synthase
MLAAGRKAEKLDHGVSVVILPDRGEKYLRTGLFMV